MTDRLAEITAAHNGAHPDYAYMSFVSGPDTYWLICEVERLRQELTSGRHTINIAGTSPESAHTVSVPCVRLAEVKMRRSQLESARLLLEKSAAELQRLRQLLRNAGICDMCDPGIEPHDWTPGMCDDPMP